VICSTGAPDYVVTAERTRKALERRRNRRPICFIDISVPRNIDPAVSNIHNVFLFDIDDLESVISSNIREREREAERAELAKQRKRLGVLTKDQETAIESLLMSTVNKISHPIISQMRRFYETGEPDVDPKDPTGLEE
jgi:glutamyl-tRNA reductase